MLQDYPHAPCSSIWLQALTVLVIVARLATAQPVAEVAGASTQTAPSGSQCPVSVQYNVNLGQGQDTAMVPIFVATVTVSNNQAFGTTTIKAWRMGWRFPFNTTIKSAQDVFDPGVRLLNPDSTTPVMEAAGGGNASETGPQNIAPGQSRQFGFLGTKGTGPRSPNNPYNVGAVSSMVFNNLLCTMITTPLPSQSQLAAPDATPGAAVTNPTQLELQYTPIQYRGQPLVNTSRQFLVRLRNIANGSTIDLSKVGFQYWFEGPDSPLPPSVAAMPWDYFEARCEWATTGCQDVALGISRGYPDVPGAHFALNVTFGPEARTLLPSGDSALPGVFLGAGIDVMDILLTITTKAGVALLNSTQDYSFLDTPVFDEPNGQINATASTSTASGTIVPRKAQANVKIPAYISGQLAWGRLPVSVWSLSLPPGTESLGRSSFGGGMGVATNGGAPVQLPEGVACEAIRGGAQQSCSLQAMYCCTSPDPSMPSVTPVVPKDWPPKARPVGPGPNGEGAAPGTEDLNGFLGISPGQEEPVTFPPLPPPGSSNDVVNGGPVPGAPPGQQGGGGSVAWVAGIAVGLAAGVVVAGGFIIAWRRKRRRRLREQQQQHIVLREDKNGAMSGSKSYSAWANGGSGGAGAGGANRGVLPMVRFGSDASQHSSHSMMGNVSPAGSNLTLLAGTTRRSTVPVAGGLWKYPSGISAASGYTDRSDPSAVLDTFSSDGGTRTLPFDQQSPFAHHHEASSSLEERSNVEIGAALAGAGGPGPLPSNVLALLERKARTAPGALFGAFRPRRSAHHRRDNPSESHTNSSSGRITADGSGSNQFSGGLPRATSETAESYRRYRRSDRNRGNTSSGSVGSNSDSDSSDDDNISETGPDIEPWQLRRNASWDGVLQDPHSSDSFSQVLRLKRRRTSPQQLSAPLPPLAPLPSPLLPSSGPAPDVDLDVDPAELEGKLGRCLGTGGFGSVYEAEWRGRKVAVKMLPPLAAGEAGHNGDAEYHALLREIQLASKFESDRLIKMLGAVTRDKNHCCLIMELAPGGSLFHRIYDRNKRRLGYLEILQLGHDIACGLAYLHPAVVHRDLKPQNVLLDGDGRAKIADFGISRVKDPSKSYFSQVTAENGTPMYMSPESMNGTRVDEKVDVFALGVILNEAWTRRQPWKDCAHFFQIILKVAINGERPWMDPDCPENLKRLITKCWHQDPRQRPSCADVMRLTDLMMQEELRKWERLSSPPGSRALGDVPEGSAVGGGRQGSFS